MSTFLKKIVKTEKCWEWVGAKDTRGYGNFKFESKVYKAHRFSYQFHKGPIPKGLVIDHLCRNTSCVNPSHLEAVTHKVNVLRGIGPTSINASKTICKRGHLLNIENVYISAANNRSCMICQKIRYREYVKNKNSNNYPAS